MSLPTQYEMIVAAFVAGWKVPAQQHGRAIDGAQRTVAELRRTEQRFELAAQGIPLGLGHAPGDAAVGHDLHRAFGKEQVHEDAVVVFRVPDTQLAEHL